MNEKMNVEQAAESVEQFFNDWPAEYCSRTSAKASIVIFDLLKQGKITKSDANTLHDLLSEHLLMLECLEQFNKVGE